MARRNQHVDAPEAPEATEEVAVTEDQAPETTEEVAKPTYEELEAKVAELQAQLDKKKGVKKDKPEKRKPDLPDGWIAPVAFRHALVERNLAAESMSPVQIYGLVRKASSNGMPVKHFDRDGNQYDEIQTHPVTGETITRPGLKLDEGLEWWKNRPKHQPGQPRKKAEESDSEATESSEDETVAIDEEFANEDADFTEAE